MSIHTMSGGMTNWFPVHDLRKFIEHYRSIFPDVSLEEKDGLVRLVQWPEHENSIITLMDWFDGESDYFFPDDNQIIAAGGICPTESEEIPPIPEMFSYFCPEGTPIIVQSVEVVLQRGNTFAGILQQRAWAFKVGDDVIFGAVEAEGDTKRIIEKLARMNEWKGVDLNWEDRDWESLEDGITAHD